MSESSRRKFLASTAAASTLAVGIQGTASATDLDAIDREYSHVDITYEQDTLERYQPRLTMTTDHIERFRHQASYVARSDRYDSYACCYVARYTVQEGATGHDSHLGDTEPCYVFVDSETDEPVEAVWTGWHWNAAGITAEDATLHPGRTNDPTHISLSVVYPWGNYQYADQDEGAFFELADWRGKREALVDGGLYDRGSTAAFEEPWVMSAEHDAKPGWWDEAGVFQDGFPPAVNEDYLTMRVWELLRIRGWDQRSKRLRETN